jgi:flagellum-specific ATP synthase
MAVGTTPDRLVRLRAAVESFDRSNGGVRVSGAVTEVFQSHFCVDGLSAFVQLGDCVMVDTDRGEVPAQVIRIARDNALVKSFRSHVGVSIGARVFRKGPFEISPDPVWKGRTLNAFAEPIDGGPVLPRGTGKRAVDAAPPNPMGRARIRQAASTGVRVIDAFMPLCQGQRIGVFAGSGVGKSTLLSMMCQSESFDSVVICLVGERGREVRGFLEEVLGERAATAITVVATGDESPMMRRLAPLTAMAVAEYFRDCGEKTLLIMDSVTRYAHALREIALAAGEPAVANGFTPGVFADLPALLERAGPGGEGAGSITGIFSVLVDGDNHNDPIADCIRGTLDGHIVLDRAIAEQGRYPAVDVLKSISRLANIAWQAGERAIVDDCRALIARFEDTRDLRLLGGYQSGLDPLLDRAVALAPQIYDKLRQSPLDPPASNAIADLAQIIDRNGADPAEGSSPAQARLFKDS